MKKSKLFENIDGEMYSTPDTVIKKGEDKLNPKNRYYQLDAIPFFVMNSGKVILCPKHSVHKEFYRKMNKVDEHNFINSIALQGRFWENDNIISV